MHFVSKLCGGEKCGVTINGARCGKPATHKIGEEIYRDDPRRWFHNMTQYVCCECFSNILGPCGAEPAQRAEQDRIRELEEWLGHAIESLRHSHRFGQEALANSLARVLKEPGGKEARDCPPL